MRNAWLLVIAVGTWCVPSTVRAADRTPAPHERAVLDSALALAGLLSTHVPVGLTSVLPQTVRPGTPGPCMTKKATAIASSCTRVAEPFSAPAPRTTEVPVPVAARLDPCARSVAFAARTRRSGGVRGATGVPRIQWGIRFGQVDIRRLRSRVLAEQRSAKGGR